MVLWILAVQTILIGACIAWNIWAWQKLKNFADIKWESPKITEWITPAPLKSFEKTEPIIKPLMSDEAGKVLSSPSHSRGGWSEEKPSPEITGSNGRKRRKTADENAVEIDRIRFKEEQKRNEQ